MTLVCSKAEILEALEGLDLIPAIEAGFVAYSAGRAIVPPVGELLLQKGEVHIKYGCIAGDPHYVVKVASGFYGNASLGLPSSNGVMLMFDQATGRLESVLLDEGHLTDIRTAVAGAIAARHLAPANVRTIGVVGTGIQARLQLTSLKPVLATRRALVLGRDPAHVAAYCRDMRTEGFDVEAAPDADRLGQECRLIVTATPSTTPLLRAAHIRPGTHITAIGSDTPEKQELEPAILARADRVVADSRAQCRLRGEIHHALKAGIIDERGIVEIGEIIAGQRPGRGSDEEVTVFDSTGVAVQDIKIAQAVSQAIAHAVAQA